MPDEPRAFLDALNDQLVRADLVVTSGGVSQGDYDVVKEALSPLGTVWFGGVAMQPGKPQGFGIVGEDATPIFTLPGNPVSSYISFEMFVLPAIRRLMGRTPYVRPTVDARADPRRSRSPEGRRQFVRGRCRSSTAGAPVTPVGGHGLAPDRRPRRVQRADRGARGRDRRSTAGETGDRCCCSTRTSDEPTGETGLTHVDESGAARMVDVSGKDVTAREAVAAGRVLVSPEVVALLRGEGVPKGDALAVARLAGIMGAKQTPTLIPLCHPLAISGGHRRPGGRRRRRRDHRDRPHHRPHRRRDGGADRGRRSPR